MKASLKLKSNKCFAQIHTNDGTKLAKMHQLFMKLGGELELGPRLENAALRFGHVQRRMAKEGSPRAAASRFEKVSRAAAENLETSRKMDPIQFPKTRRSSKKESPDSQEVGMQWEINGVTYTEEPKQAEPTEDTKEPNTKEDAAGWEIQEVAPMSESALPFLRNWDPMYAEPNCWGWQTYPTSYPYTYSYPEQYQETFAQENFADTFQEQFQEIMDLIPTTPAFHSEFATNESFFNFPDSNLPLSTELVSLEAHIPNANSAEKPSNKPNDKVIEKSDETEPLCHNCGVTSTPLWRFPSGRGRLCNACGLYYKMHQRQRPIELKKNNDAKKPPYRPRSLECMDCNSHSTSLWRRDSKTGRPLCNSCGLYRRIKNQKRPEHLYNTKIKKRHRNSNSSPDHPSSLCNTPTSFPQPVGSSDNLSIDFNEMCIVNCFPLDKN